jgi:hypothetical protein
MKWVTRKGARVDRIACPWLIQKFIDSNAEFLFVPPDQVAAVALKENAHSFDAPDARFTHMNDKCSFEILVEHFKITDPAVISLAKIVHGADIPRDIHYTPESAGLRTIADGFHLMVSDDYDNMARQFPVYDALYAYFKNLNNALSNPDGTD